jgi:hypothetical protein
MLLSFIGANTDEEPLTTTTSFSRDTLTIVEDNFVSLSTNQTSTLTLIIVVVIFTLVVFLIIIVTVYSIWQRFKEKGLGLHQKHAYKQETVSIPTLFSTNSITDCFDLSIQYKKTNPKYNSDPDFLKWSVGGEFEPLCMNGRSVCTLYSKSKSLGTVNAVEFEFWNDRSLPRGTSAIRYNV